MGGRGRGDAALGVERNEFLWPSERSGWRQYYLYKRDGTLVGRVTRDGVDVSSLAGVDEKHGFVYAIAAAPTPMQRQLFRYPLKGGVARRCA